ncbi:Rod binding domain-containing protein [Bradyrhizobium sp. CIR48]|uniref:rod-binding protein n=1 Tax=unclassified Bradyrhizobium TaxID=2631580 RepID=UPI0008EDFA45|nr:MULTISPECIES: rod-binding protein [unclassified Bradyrhizobium]MBB4377705.1 Rod binding domain-containing protein [Bradyrhizobium sp. SBR1B]MBB4428085.1 Rod binding domain-containing protein [Bradyrhizobium sp. CIR48]SFM68526.1 Rod binding protein [Bradyrhizobium sp. Rc3b]
MIVTATPDLVLDVLEAADPVTQRAATAKLDALKSSDADFAATMDAEAGKAAAEQTATKVSEAQSDVVNGAPVRMIKAPASGEVYRKFEAFILQTFVETMLPKESEQVFGKGTAGGVWKSMLAEQLGSQLAKGNGIGIAKQLAAANPAGPNGAGKAG